MRKIRSRRTRPARNTRVAVIAFLLFVSLLGLVFVISRKTPVTQLPSSASGGNVYVCRAPNGAELGMGEALQIAKNSQCARSGTLTSVPYCNSNSGTWWIDLDLWTDNLLCNPACVVSADGKRAEINYRCTGSNPSDDSRCERTGCNGEICQNASLPSRTTSCGELPEKDCYKKYASCRVQSDGQCGFTTTSQFTTCLSQATCRWCGNECKPTTETTCNDAIPPASKICTLQDNRCQAIEAPCTWCGERCERGLPSKQCTKGSSVPSGLTCNPVGTGGQCNIDGLPVLPTNAPGYCDDSCQTNSDCVGWLGCFDVGGGIKRCRKAACVGEHTCFCKVTPTPTQRPRPLITTIIRRVTATPTKTPTPTMTPSITVTPTAGVGSTPSIVQATPTPIPVGTPVELAVLASGNSVRSGTAVFTMSGSAPVFSQLRILINPDGIASTVQADENGSWNLFIPTSLSAGRKQISITATDANGIEIPFNTTITVTGEQKSMLPPQLAPYALVFVGAGAAAVIVFFLFVLRRMR